MIVAIVIAAVAVYVYGWLASARWMYGRWRAKGIDGQLVRYPRLYPDTKSAIEGWNAGDRPFAVAGALLSALVWPLVWVVTPPVLLATRIVTSTPPLSKSEIKDKLAARDRRIAELEREAGIR